jgi:hypothetical protein
MKENNYDCVIYYKNSENDKIPVLVTVATVIDILTFYKDYFEAMKKDIPEEHLFVDIAGVGTYMLQS